MTFNQIINENQNVQIEGQSFVNANSISSGYPQWSKISNCYFTKDTNFIFDSGEISFVECVFDELKYINFQFLKPSGTVTFERCVINGDLKFLKADLITITDCEIKGQISFSENKYHQVFISNDQIDRRIEKIDFSDMSENSSDGKIKLENLNVGVLRFHRSYPEIVHLFGGKYDKIILDYAKGLKELIIVGNEMDSIKIDISELRMNFYSLDGVVKLKDANIKNWSLCQFSKNEGKLTLQNLSFTDQVKIIGSDLAGTRFNDVDFRNAKIYLDWTIINDVIFANTIWPKKHKLFSVVTDSEILRLGSLTEMYRQLKKVSIFDSNNIQALHFYRNEMSSYWQRVQLDKTETWSNRLLILINKYSSNFGQSYWIPFWWIIIGHLFFCCLIWNFESSICCISESLCHSDFQNGLAEYLNWLIPFYKQPENWKSKSIIVGALMRVYNGFFIYHFIKATRKFGKV